MKKNLYLLLLLAVSMIYANTLEAQNKKRAGIGKYVQGFIITNEQDTVHGIVKIEDYEFSEVRVFFKRKKEKKNKYKRKETYKPEELTGYSFRVSENNNSHQIVDRWVHYERKTVDESPRPFASKTVFLERKESGNVNLYLYFVRSNQGVNLKRYFLLQRSSSDKTLKVTQDNFEEVVSKFIDDCPQLINRVGRADFTYYNLDRIIYNYNRCITEAKPDAE